MEKKNLIILYGGKSVEHDISILTFLQVMKNINLQKYNVYPVYINKDSKMFLCKDYENINQYIENNLKTEITFVSNNLYKKTLTGFRKVCKIHCALLCTHGTNVEDGVLQGYLEHLTIPYTSSKVMSSAINMDKAIMKQILVQNNFPCADYVSFSKNDFIVDEQTILKNIEDNLNYPVIVKPANLGSSIGITRCKTKEELLEAINVALSYDHKVVVEEVILNLREINCAVLGNGEEITISKLEEPYGWEDFLDFDEKYIKTSKKITDVKIEQDIKGKIFDLSVNAFKVMNCSGVVRIDFLVNDLSKEVYINELNSIPGSLAFYLFEGVLTFEELIDKLVEMAIKENKKKQELTYNFNSSALENTQNLKTRTNK